MGPTAPEGVPSHNSYIISIFYYLSTLSSPLATASTGLDSFQGGIADTHPKGRGRLRFYDLIRL